MRHVWVVVEEAIDAAAAIHGAFRTKRAAISSVSSWWPVKDDPNPGEDDDGSQTWCSGQSSVSVIRCRMYP